MNNFIILSSASIACSSAVCTSATATAESAVTSTATASTAGGGGGNTPVAASSDIVSLYLLGCFHGDGPTVSQQGRSPGPDAEREWKKHLEERLEEL